MIRGIIFDCFGVLYQGSINHLCELVPQSRQADLANLSKSSDYGYLTHAEFIDQVSQLVDKPSSEIEAIMRADHIRNQAMVAFVRSLRTKYKVAMLSNVGRGVMDHLFSADERDELFDVVMLSSEVGMIKPEAAIFEYTAQQLGLAPAECVMVDDIQINIDGAVATGMQGVVFTTTEKFESDIASILVK
ncbi:MAG TPA: HAD family phosphatase [Candidatus Saccharimonadales bacterium]|nr:HAD family phosphatase [Candidatus Saccharimonadales bacterium]